MKFLTPKKDVRRSNDESLGHGMDAVITLIIFLGIGFGLDAWFDTTPLFMIVLTVLGAIGLFARFYYQYEGRMQEHEAARRAKLGAQTDTSVSASSANRRDGGRAA